MFPSWDSLDELKGWQEWAENIGHWWPIVVGFIAFAIGTAWTSYNRAIDHRIDTLQEGIEARSRITNEQLGKLSSALKPRDNISTRIAYVATDAKAAAAGMELQRVLESRRWVGQSPVVLDEPQHTGIVIFAADKTDRVAELVKSFEAAEIQFVLHVNQQAALALARKGDLQFGPGVFTPTPEIVVSIGLLDEDLISQLAAGLKELKPDTLSPPPSNSEP
jgi:hypothetical protein